MIAQESDILSRQITTLPDAKRVLVLAPHPDDEVFGCGGMLALLRDQGAAITVIVVTDGAAGGENRDGSLAVSRAGESRSAATLLGLSEPVFWEYPDRGLVYGEKLIGRLSEAMLSVGADLVLLPSPTELHPDHQALALAGAEALRRQGGDCRAAFYEINIPLPNPNLFIDISSVAEQKMAAMACFTSQLQQQPYDKRIEGLNRFRSYFLGAKVASAEAFLLVEATALTPGFVALFEGPLAHRQRLGFAASGEDLPLVSIIVRSMSRPSLARALDSLALQTWPNLEVIVVNAKGGEHGPLPDQCGPFPLRLVNQGGERLSRSSAANAGLAACRGVYLGFLDDDDSMDPGHIQLLVERLEKETGQAVAYSCVRGVHEQSPCDPVVEFREPVVDFTRLLMGNLLPIHGVLFPAKQYRQHGICFDEELDLYEDWDFWLQLARRVPFVFVDSVTATYYSDGGSGVGLAFGAGGEAAKKQARKKVLAKWLPQLVPSEFDEIANLYRRTRDDLLADQAELRYTLAKRDGEIAWRDGEIAQCNADIFQRDKEIAQRNAEIATRDVWLADLYASSSWKVTAPLRWCGSKIRRCKQILGLEKS
jgi:LmbE family N-acetylglucosaminyl deacetylase/glycosyltransferase involved in cell wall biosynthesis